MFNPMVISWLYHFCLYDQVKEAEKKAMAHGIEHNGANQADVVIRKVNHYHIKLHIRMHGHHNVNLYCFLVHLPLLYQSDLVSIFIEL